MSDQIDVCNQALYLLGERGIQDLAEDTTEAEVCNAFYEDARDHCLRDLKPNFALRRSEALVNGAPPAFGWGHAAVLPEDCLLVVDIDRDELVSAVTRGPRGAKEWRVEGRSILSNREHMQILYITDKDIEAVMDASFVKALAAYLAAEISYPLTNSATKFDEMMKLYGVRADDAQATWGQESSTERTENDQLTIVR